MLTENDSTKITIQFLGAAGVVTGSRHLLHTSESNILVDCGLFQGLKTLRDLNRKPFDIEPASIQAIIITHAHLDHTGYLPVLVRDGFAGKIYLTGPTMSLTEIILFDSAKLQEEDADHANKMGYSKHKPALPLYTQEDVRETVKHMQVCAHDEWTSLSENVQFRFKKNGHILGSCFVEMDCFNKRIVFSGDLGRKESYTLNPPLLPEKADILVIESTYGDRLHPSVSPEKELTDIIQELIHKQGTLLIPSFAVGRAQELMLLINLLKKKNMIPDLPVYLDSPMSKNATEVYKAFPDWHKLSPKEIAEMWNNIVWVRDLKETYKVIDLPGPKIVIAASGMLTGGRVLHYLRSYLVQPKNTILLVGYQAAGTRGRALRSKVHELKLFGKYFPVKADVKEIATLSAHADQHELLEWMKALPYQPERIFIVHGEAEASHALELKLLTESNWNSITPIMKEKFVLPYDSGIKQTTTIATFPTSQ
jgi:metallo-beta-lactamase family protein